MLSEREQAVFAEIQRRFGHDPDTASSTPATRHTTSSTTSSTTSPPVAPAARRTPTSRTFVIIESVAALLAVAMVFTGAYGWALVFVAAAITAGLANHVEVQNHRDPR